MMVQLAAGIDIGGTNIKFGLVDEDGKIHSKDSVPTADFPDPKDLVNTIAEKIGIFLKGKKEAVNSKLIGIGIGAPNSNYFKGTIEFAVNLKWKGVIPLAKYFHDKLNVPAFLTNDAKAAALGEMQFGGAKGMKDFISITLGTGLGSGIVANGKLIYGHDGFAGELGHTIIIQYGRQCSCGRKGCLEQYCSATGIVKTYFEILKSENPHALDALDTNQIDSKYIYEQALSGNEAAFYAFNYTGELLGYALANSVAYTSPQTIFLSGGLAQAGELIFNPTILSFEKNLLPVYKSKSKINILASSLKEDDAAILGAASLIWQQQ
jgi:glucokinase